MPYRLRKTRRFSPACHLGIAVNYRRKCRISRSFPPFPAHSHPVPFSITVYIYCGKTIRVLSCGLGVVSLNISSIGSYEQKLNGKGKWQRGGDKKGAQGFGVKLGYFWFLIWQWEMSSKGKIVGWHERGITACRREILMGIIFAPSVSGRVPMGDMLSD